MFPQKLLLANIPTPLKELTFNQCKFLIKRDDLTGLELSGNKVRKLEYLLWEAKKKKAGYIFTCGGDQSNHCRASVYAAASIGIKSKIFLWGKDSFNVEGNHFLNKFIGAEIKYLTKKEYSKAPSIMEEDKLHYEKRGEKVFIIPEGGSSELGIWGYINFMDELKSQAGPKINGILTAAGSGGTSAGLLVGAALNNTNLKIFAVNVLYPAKVIKEKILNLANSCITKYKLNCKIDESKLEVMDGYSSEGYKKITDGKLEVIKSFAQCSGIVLDPVYTGKAFYAFNEHFLRNKKQTKVIFIHTGGIFGVFNKRNEYLSASYH